MSSAAQIAKLIDEFPSEAALEAYVSQYHDLVGREDISTYVRNLAINVKLKGSKFRGLAWKIYLGVLSPARETWKSDVASSRAQFRQIQLKYGKKDSKSFNGDPLGTSETCPDDSWRMKFKDEELRSLIRQDVDRTIPEVAFFQSNKIRNLMCDLLFLYAKVDPRIGYKQGMHEILAPIIFTLHCDAAATQHLSSVGRLPQDLLLISNGSELAGDCYIMFSRVMRSCRKWYIDPEPEARDATSELEYYIRDVYHNHLKSVDIELYRHLERHHILPQVYAVRWLRLLFGREFPMQDLLCVWDFLFATNLEMVSSFFVAMLVGQRILLLNDDAGNILSTLMRYPQPDDVANVIEQTKTIEKSRHGLNFAKTKKNIDQKTSLVINKISDIYSKIDKGIKDIVDSDTKPVVERSKFDFFLKKYEEQRQMSLFCAARLDAAVQQLSSLGSVVDGDTMVSVATVKQVRDFLCGSLKWKDMQKHEGAIHPATIQWLNKQINADDNIEEAEEAC